MAALRTSETASSCCAPGCFAPVDKAACCDASAAGANAAALEASLGCGVPTAVADLHEGETVLDLSSGAGADVLISARAASAPPVARSAST